MANSQACFTQSLCVPLNIVVRCLPGSREYQGLGLSGQRFQSLQSLSVSREAARNSWPERLLQIHESCLSFVVRAPATSSQAPPSLARISHFKGHGWPLT